MLKHRHKAVCYLFYVDCCSKSANTAYDKVEANELNGERRGKERFQRKGSHAQDTDDTLHQDLRTTTTKSLSRSKNANIQAPIGLQRCLNIHSVLLDYVSALSVSLSLSLFNQL